MKTKILLLIIFLTVSISGFSKVWKISNSGNTYTPSTITINVGDTINFAIEQYHNAVEVSYKTWSEGGTTGIIGGFGVPFNGGMVLPAKLGVGTHYFVCTPHASLGMKGTIIVQGTTAISNEQLISDISIYPNPATDLINVKAGNALLGSPYFIADQTGRYVLNGKLNEETSSLNISQLPSGIYLFMIGDIQKQTFKIVKK